jgi:GH15 family glucan-1,4-alpha-glucosidase
VGRDGSLDWLCLPRFDDRACFAALLGAPEHGRWRLAPVEGGRAVRRRYRGYSLVLEQEFETSSGAMRLIDFMPIRRREPDVVRIVEGLRGPVRCRADLDIRFDYGSVVPWMRTHEGVIQAIGGPDALTLWSPPRWEVRDGSAWAEFDVGAGERVPFVMAWHPSYEEPSPPVDALEAVEASEAWWREWAARCPYEGQWRDAVMRSLVTLKALTNAPSGGILAAATTSLPEHLSGVRNWDYRHCWLRDATFTIYALLGGGFTDEAAAWHDWLLRATAGSPTDIRIMYGCGGERRIPELELP